MKGFKTLLLVIGFMITFTSQSQTVDEIIDGYFENTGGKANWQALKGIKMSINLNQQGMEIPIEVVRMADGKQYTKITIQGTVLNQGVYDGETLWNTNMMNMTAEKSETEQTENYRLDINDFPDDLINYKKNNYTAELLDNETIDGSEAFKIKLTKEPKMSDGQSVEDVVYYYFDTEALVPVAQDTEIKQGPQKGLIMRIKLSDYSEVEGLYFPFSMSQGMKDGPSQSMRIQTIELNPTVQDSDFAFPGN